MSQNEQAYTYHLNSLTKGKEQAESTVEQLRSREVIMNEQLQRASDSAEQSRATENATAQRLWETTMRARSAKDEAARFKRKWDDACQELGDSVKECEGLRLQVEQKSLEVDQTTLEKDDEAARAEKAEDKVQTLTQHLKAAREGRKKDAADFKAKMGQHARELDGVEEKIMQQRAKRSAGRLKTIKDREKTIDALKEERTELKKEIDTLRKRLENVKQMEEEQAGSKRWQKGDEDSHPLDRAKRMQSKIKELEKEINETIDEKDNLEAKVAELLQAELSRIGQSSDSRITKRRPVARDRVQQEQKQRRCK